MVSAWPIHLSLKPPKIVLHSPSKEVKEVPLLSKKISKLNLSPLLEALNRSFVVKSSPLNYKFSDLKTSLFKSPALKATPSLSQKN